MRSVASAADVTPSAIYYRFHDKVGLLAAVAEPLMSDLEALLTGTSASVRSIDRVEVMRGYLLAILQHREAAQVLLFDPSAGGTAPAERLADQQRRMVALLVGPRATIDRQVRTRCAVAIAQLGAGELKGVPGHRLRKPLWEAAIDVLLGTAEPRIHVSEMGDAMFDVRSPRHGADPGGQCANAEALRRRLLRGRARALARRSSSPPIGSLQQSLSRSSARFQVGLPAFDRCTRRHGYRVRDAPRVGSSRGS